LYEDHSLNKDLLPVLTPKTAISTRESTRAASINACLWTSLFCLRDRDGGVRKFAFGVGHDGIRLSLRCNFKHQGCGGGGEFYD